ncbi:MAG: rRNA maturation RNase YbeY [Rhizobiales bacterium]|nr:rRNA maturation RNase YbeY [Hyphomicrobiales bacterium]
MGTTPDPLSVDIIVESPLWDAQPLAETVLRRALSAAAAMLSTRPAELAIVLTDDSTIRGLNHDWRNIDRPTNVLSFPVRQLPQHSGGQRKPAAPPTQLGDIVIAYETATDEAKAEAKRFEDHLAHLAVHGFLHLLGQDHDNDSDAEAMEGLERAILARLGIPDPYATGDLVPTAGRHA